MVDTMKGDPRSHGLWEQSAPIAPTTSRLEESISADVAVIGAGFTGLSAALHLREMNADAAVLEAEAIGFGGSGRNVGLVNAGLSSSGRRLRISSTHDSEGTVRVPRQSSGCEVLQGQAHRLEYRNLVLGLATRRALATHIE